MGQERRGRATLMTFAAMGALAIAGCSRSNGTSEAASGGASGAAAAGGDQAYAAGRSRSGSAYGGGYGERADRAPAPMFHGEPEWSQNRSHTAQENAQYHFERAGADLGAKTLDDFLTKVHHFGDHPPAGALKLTRANGDRLLYDPKSNLFAVFTRDGAPRTVFKPSSGMDYWTEQKAREQADASGGGYHRRSYSGGGYGRSEGSGGSTSGDQGD